MLLLMDQNSYNGRWNCCISHWVFSFLKPSSNWLCSDELSHLVTKPTFQPLRIPGWRSLHHVVCLRARFGGLSMRGRVYGSEAWWNEAKFHEICISHDRIHGTNGIYDRSTFKFTIKINHSCIIGKYTIVPWILIGLSFLDHLSHSSGHHRINSWAPLAGKKWTKLTSNVTWAVKKGPLVGWII